MADFITPENPMYMPVRKYEVTDAAHADLFNDVTEKLVNNDEFLKKETEKTGADISILKLRVQGHCEDTSLHVSENERTTWNNTYLQSVDYTDSQIEKLIGAAPETLDSLEEIANAIKNNETVAEALNTAIETKANQTEVSGLADAVKNNETAVEALNAAMGTKANQTEVSGLADAVKNNGTAVGALNAAMGTKANQTEVSGLADAVKNNETAVGALSTAMGTKANEAKVVELANAVKSNETAVGALNTAMGTKANKTEVTELANAVKNNETAVGTLNTAIGAKANAADLASHTGNQNIHYTKSSIVNMLYPVGSIYQSSKSTDPGALFGGTWRQIKDVVLVAAGSAFAAGGTGGSVTHTLAIGNLPYHNHSFSGSAVNTGGNSVTPSATFNGTAVTSGGQSTNHTHSIPALSGSAASAGAHTHTLGNVGGHINIFSSTSGWEHGHILWDGGTHKTSSAGAHTHTVKTTASTSGNNSANHTHSITAKGTVGLSNTSHYHTVTASGTIGYAGSGVAVNHMPPYKVMYVWERIS